MGLHEQLEYFLTTTFCYVSVRRIWWHNNVQEYDQEYLFIKILLRSGSIVTI